YGVSKLTAENYVRKYFEDVGLETVCLRYFNVYGPRQDYCDYSGVITLFINCVKKGLPLTVFGDGEQTRDFVYVEDVVEANLLALKRDNATGEVFNIGYGKEYTVNEVFEKVVKRLGKEGEIQPAYVESYRGEFPRTFADNSKARKVLGWNPLVDLDKGLDVFVKWFLSEKEKIV
ncbi:MAG: NAD-dependent epimerase/dehydratase family protein, partial [Candidatus Bathyarchaeia archaeon]